MRRRRSGLYDSWVRRISSTENVFCIAAEILLFCCSFISFLIQEVNGSTSTAIGGYVVYKYRDVLSRNGFYFVEMAKRDEESNDW